MVMLRRWLLFWWCGVSLVLLLVVVGPAQAAVAAIEDDDGDDILDLDDLAPAADTTTTPTTTDHRVDRREKVLPLTVVNVADDVFDSIFDNNATTTTTISAAAAAAAIVDAVVDAAIATTTSTEKDNSTDDDDDKKNEEIPPGVVEDEQQTKQDDEATSAVDESKTATTTNTTIRPELLPMTNDQLTAVCLDRGFDIRKGDGTTLTRDDLLQAATRCLQLADAEMHDVLDDDHPELLLAVELESEIQRMKVEKERLESEQAKMLREKAFLEEQLREAGIDPGGIWSGTTSSKSRPPPSNSTGISSTTTLNAVVANGGGGGGGDSLETLEDVLRTSFTMLFDRIGRDMNLVGKVLGYVVVKPGSAVLAVLWRYSAPTVEGLVQQVLVVADQVLATGPMVTFRQQLIGPVVDTLLPVARPVLVQARSAIRMGWKKLDTIESVHKGVVLAGSVLGPLKNSLLIGWRNTLQPNLAIARRKSTAWWQRLRLETKAKQQQQQQQQQQQLFDA
jgi:hypothetical protein